MGRRVTVTFEPLGKRIEVEYGTPLGDLLHPLGFEFPCSGKGLCGGCKIKILKGNIELDTEHKRALNHLGFPVETRLACRSRVTEDITIEAAQWESIILTDATEFTFAPESGKGIAVDVGTTTIVAQLLDLETGSVLGVERSVNPQTRFGADLMTRIQYTLENESEELTAILRREVGAMIGKLAANYTGEVKKINLVGNTAMHHLFSGLPVDSLAFYPFESPHKSIRQFTADELKWNVSGNAVIRFLPSIGGFVGSDILAGIIASKMNERAEFSALLDLGTNGEICIGSRDAIVCASTAAGPAFEGTNISMGMRAVTGAISEVALQERGYRCHVIGGGSPRGICGSGLIDAAAAALDNGSLSPDGTIADDKERIVLMDSVAVSQRDIRELQLAKGAIQAGMQILMRKLNISYNDISNFYIAGAFGNSLNYDNTAKLGLFNFPQERITKLGNSALLGAKISLYGNPENSYKSILEKTSVIPLEKEHDFQDIFAGSMFFSM